MRQMGKIGLEYIIFISGDSNKDLAKALGDIDVSNITIWLIERRKIPRKYLPIMSERYGVPEQYFQAHLDELAKKEIDGYIISNQTANEKIEYTCLNEFGKPVTFEVDEMVSGSLDAIDLNNAEQSYLRAIQRIRNIMFGIKHEDISEIIRITNRDAELLDMVGEVLESNQLYQTHMSSMLRDILYAILLNLGERATIDADEESTDDERFISNVARLIKQEEEDHMKKIEILENLDL